MDARSRRCCSDAKLLEANLYILSVGGIPSHILQAKSRTALTGVQSGKLAIWVNNFRRFRYTVVVTFERPILRTSMLKSGNRHALTIGFRLEHVVKLLLFFWKPPLWWADNVSCICCRALLECYVGSQEKLPGTSENAINALRYVQKNAPQYYKQLFSLIVSLSSDTVVSFFIPFNP